MCLEARCDPFRDEVIVHDVGGDVILTAGRRLPVTALLAWNAMCCSSLPLTL
jgi:hypothetical protein